MILVIFLETRLKTIYSLPRPEDALTFHFTTRLQSNNPTSIQQPDFNPTTRLQSNNPTSIQQPDFNPTTRLQSNNPTSIQQPDFNPTTRLQSNNPTSIQQPDFNPTTPEQRITSFITMGLIKTAMMSGAAMYGINQLAKTAQSRQSNPNPPRREYSERDYDTTSGRPLEFRAPDSRNQRYPDQTRDFQNPGRMSEGEPTQRLHLEDQHRFDRQPYYTQACYNELPQYEYASNTRSSSAPSRSFWGQGQQRGFVEPEEVTSDSQEQQGGSRANMLNALAQQAMNMGLTNDKRGQRDKHSKGDLLGSLVSR